VLDAEVLADLLGELVVDLRMARHAGDLVDRAIYVDGVIATLSK
jgi:hypothetical protein